MSEIPTGLSDDIDTLIIVLLLLLIIDGFIGAIKDLRRYFVKYEWWVDNCYRGQEYLKVINIAEDLKEDR